MLYIHVCWQSKDSQGTKLEDTFLALIATDYTCSASCQLHFLHGRPTQTLMQLDSMDSHPCNYMLCFCPICIIWENKVNVQL